MGRFLRIGGVWVRHVNNSCNFDPRTRLGVKCKEQLAEPCKKNLFWNNYHLRDKCGTLVKQTQQNLGGTMHKTLVEPFGSPKQICPREPWRVRKQFCPETFAMAEDPKATAVGEKTALNFISWCMFVWPSQVPRRWSFSILSAWENLPGSTCWSHFSIRKRWSTKHETINEAKNPSGYQSYSEFVYCTTISMWCLLRKITKYLTVSSISMPIAFPYLFRASHGFCP